MDEERESRREETDRPRRFALFVGRASELVRLGEMVADVPATIVIGVPGVGKSALAQAFAARWRGAVVRQRVSDAPLAALLDDVRRQLAGDVIDDVASDHARVADIAVRLAVARGLWLLDDFHRLADADQATLLDAFAQTAGAARLVATSRQAPLPRVGLVDHAQLRLDPLDESAGRELWTALDELYGASQRFDVAWRRSHGLPILLRQAHAGGFDQADPIEAAVHALSPDERALAGALALSEMPLPAVALVEMMCNHERARTALRSLVSRLVVDIDGADGCTLHDLFAASVCAALDDSERRALHLSLAGALMRLDLDPAIRARNLCAHLIAAGHENDAAAWLVLHASDLVHRGAAGELLRAIESLPPERRPPALRIERARALVRVLDFSRALGELRQLALSGADIEHSDEVQISLAQVALFTGDARLTHGTLLPLLTRDNLPIRQRLRAAVTLAVASTHLGLGDEGRRALAAVERSLTAGEPAEVLAAYRAFTFWIEERDDEAMEALRHAGDPTRDDVHSYRAAMTPGIFGVILARQGRIEEAERALTHGQRILGRRADPLFQLELAFGHALYLYEAGERIEAVRRMTRIHEAYVRSGYYLGTLFVGSWLARALLLLGRRAEGLDRLAHIEEAARARGLEGICAVVERARAVDPLVQLAQPSPPLPRSRKSLQVRAHALEALRAAAAGDVARARDLVAAQAAATQAPGYALDRALAHVADAVAARLEGAAATAEEALARALGEPDPAAADAFDLELPRALADAVGRLRVITPEHKRLCSAYAVPASAKVVIDARAHELRSPGVIVPLRTRPIVRRLLYALAAHAGRPISKEALASAAWERDYSPLVHDNPLKSNVGHLRRLVAASGLVIIAEEIGYRLELPPGAVFIDVV